MLKKIREFFSQKGQGVVEYALLLGFVGIVIIALYQEDGLTNVFRNTLGAIKTQFTTFNEAYSSGG